MKDANNYLSALQVWDSFQAEVKAFPNKEHLIIAIERTNKSIYRFEFDIFPEGLADDRNYLLTERIIKSLLWIVGGYRVYYAGPHSLFTRLKATFSFHGQRSFDVNFMQSIYHHRFSFIERSPSKMPSLKEESVALPHISYQKRIGLDLGGTHIKICAMENDNLLWSNVIPWTPKVQNNPQYHKRMIQSAIDEALLKLDGDVESIGISSAGIFFNNQVHISVLFMNVKDEQFQEDIRNIFIKIQNEIVKKLHHPIHFRVANDGDVTALSGSKKLNQHCLLGISMGTSEAAGYIDHDGNLNGWLNELAFVPFIWDKNSDVDPWSLDYGTGASYLCQEGILSLANLYHMELDSHLSASEKVKSIQKSVEENNPHAISIFQTMGQYLAYAIAYYQMFYKIEHVLILGGVMNGRGGDILLDSCRHTLLTLDNCSLIIVHSLESQNRQIEQAIAASYL